MSRQTRKQVLDTVSVVAIQEVIKMSVFSGVSLRRLPAQLLYTSCILKHIRRLSCPISKLHTNMCNVLVEYFPSRVICTLNLSEHSTNYHESP